ncbi:hypothetical protein [Georgenia alba]|uniref:ScoMcrA-like SRA domain-containing protein n=1 Tax=Georgenia alba TaxID=2233858 RepID=A0ABW2QBA7_9MICO
MAERTHVGSTYRDSIGEMAMAEESDVGANYRWTLVPGDYLTREERRARYGGALFGGIEPSRKTPNLFVYSDPAAGEAYGYNFDGWDDVGDVFLYTGEGHFGDQMLRDGNKALLNHKADGRALRLFVADGIVAGTASKNHIYIGEFEIDLDAPYIRADAPGTDGEMRSVLVFRLRPVSGALRREKDLSVSTVTNALQDSTKIVARNIPDLAVVSHVAPEAIKDDRFDIDSFPGGYGFRREARLVADFRKHLEQQGHEVLRHQITPPDSIGMLYTDLYDALSNVLYEAKGTATREAVRLAIGQLFDYRRYIHPKPQLSILLPVDPGRDIIGLLSELGIGCVVQRHDLRGFDSLTLPSTQKR